MKVYRQKLLIIPSSYLMEGKVVARVQEIQLIPELYQETLFTNLDFLQGVLILVCFQETLQKRKLYFLQ